MSVDMIQAIAMPVQEERLCYICCEPDSPENQLISEKPCLCKTMEIHNSCYQQLRQTLGGTCKACKVDFPWRPLLVGNQRMHTFTESARPDLKFMTIYEVDAQGRPHGRTETVRYEEERSQADRYWCDSCEDYHDDLAVQTKPGIKSLSSVGQFNHGLRHGLWHLYSCTAHVGSGQPWITVPYENGVPHGIVLLKYHKDGGNVEETFTMANGVIQGQRTIVYKTQGYKLTCNYLDGKLHGTLSLKHSAQAYDVAYAQTTLQEYHHGDPKGNRITYMQRTYGPLKHKKMLHSVVGIRNGMLNGTTTVYYPGPCKKLCMVVNYRDGILKGAYKHWDERGELIESHFFTGEEHYMPTEEYLAIREVIDDNIQMTHYEVPVLKAHIMTSVDPDHQVGFAYPDASLLSKTAPLAVMDSSFSAVMKLKHFKGYFQSSTYNDYSERYNDEDYYSDGDDVSWFHHPNDNLGL
jgi:antitoxin component YwqK of YwqJK toxin-antitoxin module